MFGFFGAPKRWAKHSSSTSDTKRDPLPYPSSQTSQNKQMLQKIHAGKIPGIFLLTHMILVGGLEHVFFLLGMSSSQLTGLFFRGVGRKTTNQYLVAHPTL